MIKKKVGPAGGHVYSPSAKKARRDDSASDDEEFAHIWTLDKERHLCMMWREASYMYNSMHEDHRNADKRRRTLQRFGAALNLDGKNITCIKSLMATFFIPQTAPNYGRTISPCFYPSSTLAQRGNAITIASVCG